MNHRYKITFISVLGFIVLLGSTAVALQQIDIFFPWANTKDLNLVANTAYPTAINQTWELILITQNQIDQARIRDDQASVLNLKRQLRILQDKLKRLEKEQNKFQ